MYVSLRNPSFPVVVYWACTKDSEADGEVAMKLAYDQAWLNVTVTHFSHNGHEPSFVISGVSENCYKVTLLHMVNCTAF